MRPKTLSATIVRIFVVAVLKTAAAVCRLTLWFPPTSFLAWKIIPAFRRRFRPNIEIETVYCGSVRFVARLNDHIESQIFWQGVQEGDRGKLALMLRALEPENVLFDVGANVGTFTLAAASRLPDGKVHAFEPWPTHLERLATNIRLNKFENIHVNPFALSNESREGFLHILDPVNTGMATLYPGKNKLVGQSFEKVEIFCETIDKYVRVQNVTRIDVMKIDVEGAELSVLEGGNMTLNRFRPTLFMELNPNHLARAGTTPESIFRFLSRYGYSIARIEDDAELTPLECHTDLTHHQNVYCRAE